MSKDLVSGVLNFTKKQRLSQFYVRGSLGGVINGVFLNVATSGLSCLCCTLMKYGGWIQD